MSKNKNSSSGNNSAANSLPFEGRMQEIQSGGRLLKERKLLCKICDINFSTFPSLKDHLSALHMVKITRKSPFCQFCEESFPSLHRFQTHLHREHTEEKIDACVKCRFKLPREIVVPTRPSGDIFSNHYCIVCQEETKARKRKMKADSRILNNEKKKVPDGIKQTGTKKKCVRCEVCQTSYVSNARLKNHLLTKHGVRSEDKPYQCAMCQKGFSTPSYLRIHHQKEHVEVKPFACGLCDQRFSFEYQLQKHHSRVHNPPRWRCDVCQKEVSLQFKGVHTRTHLGIMPHACDTCDKRFASMSKLKTHLMTHTGEKPHACDACGKKFNRIHHLKTHFRVHTGERPYVCDICRKGFTQKWVMDAHRRIHTGERPFECDVCQKGFIYKSQLKTHLLKHDKMQN